MGDIGEFGRIKVDLLGLRGLIPESPLFSHDQWGHDLLVLTHKNNFKILSLKIRNQSLIKHLFWNYPQKICWNWKN